MSAQARIPEIEELQKQLTQTTEELNDLSFQANEDKANAAGRETQHQQELILLQNTVAQLHEAKQGLEQEVHELKGNLEGMDQALQEKADYLTQLEGTVGSHGEHGVMACCGGARDLACSRFQLAVA